MVVIYLALIAIGFYFGKWLGAIALAGIYFYFFHVRRLTQAQTRKNTTLSSNDTDLTWAYRELGVAQSADSHTVKQARKRLLNHYHPDKLGQADASEKQAAEQKVDAINRAYAAIKQHKGF